MTPQKFDCTTGLMSLLFKSVGLSASAAILLASSSAFALSNNQAPETSQSQLSHDTLLAQDVEVETEPQESKPDPEVSKEPRFTCQPLKGQYTVMYYPESQPGQSYTWATPSALGGAGHQSGVVMKLADVWNFTDLMA